MVFQHFVVAHEAVQQTCCARDCRRLCDIFIDFVDDLRLEISQPDIHDNSVEVLALLESLQMRYKSCESSNSIPVDAVS